MACESGVFLLGKWDYGKYCRGELRTSKIIGRTKMLESSDKGIGMILWGNSTVVLLLLVWKISSKFTRHMDERMDIWSLRYVHAIVHMHISHL